MEKATLACAIPFLVSTLSFAEQPALETIPAYANSELPMNVYWGDTHLHSYLSLDAATAGPAEGGYRDDARSVV